VAKKSSRRILQGYKLRNGDYREIRGKDAMPRLLQEGPFVLTRTSQKCAQEGRRSTNPVLKMSGGDFCDVSWEKR